jgi:SAM-dependent methyltransferase
MYHEMVSAAMPEQIELLAELAGPAPMLELGVGTGRLALPLVERGLEVHGLDVSPAMVECPRAKPGGDQVRVTMGDFPDLELGTRFRLVFVAFNTPFALPDQLAQLDCFRAVSRHLVPGGRFLVEAFVPDVPPFHRGQLVSAVGVGLDRVDLECSVHDPVTQSISTQRLVFGTGGARSYPVKVRYAWPAELDLMAKSPGCKPRAARESGADSRSRRALPGTSPSGRVHRHHRPEG